MPNPMIGSLWLDGRCLLVSPVYIRRIAPEDFSFRLIARDRVMNFVTHAMNVQKPLRLVIDAETHGQVTVHGIAGSKDRWIVEMYAIDGGLANGLLREDRAW